MRAFYLLLSLPLSAFGHLVPINENSEPSPPHTIEGLHRHSYSNPIAPSYPQQEVIIKLRNATHIITRLTKRDSVTIKIENSFQNTTVINSQNNAKFEVINNAKNANIAMGDKSNHTLDFDSFGDKNMLNSTGSNTGGWNTKNSDSHLSTAHHRIRRWWKSLKKYGHDDLNMSRESKLPIGTRDVVNLDVKGGSVKNSNVTRSGNGNTVEVYVSGNGENVVNITLSWEMEDSTITDSNSENKVKIYIGDARGVDMRNSTVLITGR
ncbi:hypothetical protein VTL71DRAFT_2150 [Oculimacula yallundae]|uniref:Uncharacterized protein n=1 Tax=Oculimacula yallundae TaxID=86028 RepID=A0ABR4CA11_9HELO